MELRQRILEQLTLHFSLDEMANKILQRLARIDKDGPDKRCLAQASQLINELERAGCPREPLVAATYQGGGVDLSWEVEALFCSLQPYLLFVTCNDCTHSYDPGDMTTLATEITYWVTRYHSRGKKNLNALQP